MCMMYVILLDDTFLCELALIMKYMYVYGRFHHFLLQSRRLFFCDIPNPCR